MSDDHSNKMSCSSLSSFSSEALSSNLSMGSSGWTPFGMETFSACSNQPTLPPINVEPSDFDYLLITTGIMSSPLQSAFSPSQPLVIHGNKFGKRLTFTVGPDGLIAGEMYENHVNIPYNDLETVGKYIGSGSFGHVVVAKHKVTGKKYALKMIYQDSNRLDFSQKMEWAEFAAIYLCDHHSLLKVHECYYRNFCFYMLLDYCNCGSLRDIFKIVSYEQMTERILSIIIEKVLVGLNYLQEHHIIHRDIKPENILVNYSKKEKKVDILIGDFGLCGHKTVEAGSTYFKTVNGTFLYRSPERLLENHYNYTSDIWSLGVMAVEIITGVHPLVNSDISDQNLLPEVPNKIISAVKNYTFGKNHDRTLSSEFIDFITQCVEYEKEKRPFARDLIKHPWIHKFKDGKSGEALLCEWLVNFFIKKKKRTQSISSSSNVISDDTH